MRTHAVKVIEKKNINSESHLRMQFGEPYNNAICRPVAALNKQTRRCNLLTVRKNGPTGTKQNTFQLTWLFLL